MYRFRILILLALLVPGVTAAQSLGEALRDTLQHAPEAIPRMLNRERLRRFYELVGYRPVWHDEAGPNRRAVLLLQRLEDAGSEGLIAGHYLIGEIAPRMASGDEPLQLELLLSDAFFDYARDLRRGRFVPGQVAPLWSIEPETVDPVALLLDALDEADFSTVLDALPPSHPAYARLRKALAEYRAIEARGGWPFIPSGPLLRPGGNDPRTPLLRRRLQIEGDLPMALSGRAEHYDEGLAYAVRRFQVRHGLKVDGIVGEETLEVLNVPVEQRIEQIILTMERWRWLPQELGERHVIVNIPAYELVVYEAGRARMSMPVIIGSRERPTPVTTGLLHTVVFNPYWTVPRNIAVNDLVPKQRRDPDYLTDHNIRVFSTWNGGHELSPSSIDWKALNEDNFPYMLRQDPGPRNALGQVKFLFNNRFSVYLHDTPNGGLFAESVRAYSSGCIRVEEPERLASFMLEGDEAVSWSEEAVASVIRTHHTREQELSEPIPVYLLYLTVWVGEDNSVNFRNDIYGEDTLLAMCMPYEESEEEPGR